MSNNDEGWTVVTASDKKRVMRKRGRKATNNNCQSVVATTTLIDGFIKDTTVLRSCLDECIQYLLQTDLWKKVFQEFWRNNEERFNQIKEIVCYGIGNFSKTSVTYYSASLWQLSFIICLRNFLNDSNNIDIRIWACDPCTTRFEESFLKEELNIHILRNDRGIHTIHRSTIFYMPHCPARLYENIIWSNWGNNNNNNNMLILGNSIFAIAGRRKQQNVRQQSSSSSFLSSLLPFLHDFTLQSTKRDNNNAPGNFFGAFNDTYWTTFTFNNNEQPWPEKPNDIKIIYDDDPELL